MPLTKNPIYRYRVIDSCFSNKQKRYWTIQELIEKLGSYDLVVNKRTLERDFESMRHDERLGYNAPIAYDKTEKAFYYTDPDFTIKELRLTAEDFEVLTVAAGIIQTYKGVKLVDQFEAVLDKLVRLAGHLEEPGRQKTIIAAEETPHNESLYYFDLLAAAIHNKQTLVVVYQKFLDETHSAHIVYPYFLKEYQDRWYLLGYCELRERIITFGLDRITAIGPLKAEFRENIYVKPEEYFKHTVGISLGRGPVEEVELWFSPEQAPYVKTQHLHQTQKIVSDHDIMGLVITLQVVLNHELIALLLRYGSEVKVLKPVILRRFMCHEIGRMFVKYDDEDHVKAENIYHYLRGL